MGVVFAITMRMIRMVSVVRSVHGKRLVSVWVLMTFLSMMMAMLVPTFF